jgi:AmmeMemoRadiSam system protein A
MLNERQQRYLLEIARETIDTYIKYNEIPNFHTTDPELLTSKGVFVTLKKYNKLRGCIGYIQPIEALYKAVSKMAIAASTQDWRFPPVTEDELNDITIEITVLSELTPISDISQIEIGVHGVEITKDNHSAVFLPQVALEQSWNREQLLHHLCKKAGLKEDDWKSPDAKICVFTGQIFSE